MNVKGYRNAMPSDPYFNLYYNESQCILEIQYSSSLNATSTKKQWTNFNIPSSLRPPVNISFMSFLGIMFNIDTGGNLYYQSITGSNISTQIWLRTFWSY